MLFTYYLGSNTDIVCVMHGGYYAKQNDKADKKVTFDYAFDLYRRLFLYCSFL